MIRVKNRLLMDGGWEKGAGGSWYLKTREDPQTHLHLQVSGEVVNFVSIKFKDQYHGHFYSGGLAFNRGNLEDLPEDVQTLFRVGLNRIGMV
jgi:hypothetical protein